MKKLRKLKLRKAFSLVEITVAIAIFTLVVSSVAVFSISSAQSNRNSLLKIAASQTLQETSNAIQINKKDVWLSLVNNTANGNKEITFANNKYTISNGTNTLNGISVYFTVDYVYRDGSGNIATSSSGTLDNRSRSINLTSSWMDVSGQTKTLATQIYVNDWSSLTWQQTTQVDFNAGNTNLTNVTNTSGGELQLNQILVGNWGNPTYLSSLDLPGNYYIGGYTTIVGSYAYVVQNRFNGADDAKLHLIDISTKSTPVLKSTIDFNLYDIIAIEVVGNYAFVLGSVPTNSTVQQIIVLDVSNPSSPFTAYTYNANNWVGPTDMKVVGGYCYVLAQGDNTYAEFFILNCSNPLNITQVGSLQLASTYWNFQKESINGNFAYLSSTNNTAELVVVDITTKTAPVFKVKYDLPGTADAIDIYNQGNYTYISRDVSTSPEFYVLNTSNLAAITVVGTYKIGYKAYAISVDVANNFVFVATASPTQQFLILDISSLASITKYGSVTTSSSAVDIVVLNNYAYLTSLSTTQEFQIIFGGRGGSGGPSGIYENSGTFTSSIFDTGSTAPQYISTYWSQTLPANTTATIQLRVSDTSAGIASASWFGTDGTVSTYFSSPSYTYIPTIAQGKRYVQYKLFLGSDGSATPIFQDINLDYQQ